jgi:hypothetical protein
MLKAEAESSLTWILILLVLPPDITTGTERRLVVKFKSAVKPKKFSGAPFFLIGPSKGSA